jgi:hypothetical protein
MSRSDLLLQIALGGQRSLRDMYAVALPMVGGIYSYPSSTKAPHESGALWIAVRGALVVTAATMAASAGMAAAREAGAVFAFGAVTGVADVSLRVVCFVAVEVVEGP